MKYKKKGLNFAPEGKSKGLGKGLEVSDETLELINEYALVPLKPEDIYVGKILIAHNAVDRDNERFNEKTLAGFKDTFPGKSLLIGHRWGPPGQGTVFESEIKKVDQKTAKEMTGEDFTLPKDQEKVHFLKIGYYTVLTDTRADLLKDIDAGVVRHASIGFNADSRVPIIDGDGKRLYSEYQGKGEALEASLVWLGAQPGATTTKSAGADEGVEGINDNDLKKEEGKSMKKLLSLLGLGDETDEGTAVKNLGLKLTRLKHLENLVEPLGEEASADSVKSIMAEAADGKAFKKSLIETQMIYERKLKRFDDTPEASESREKQLSSRSVGELRDEIKYLETSDTIKALGKGPQIQGKSGGENRDNGEAGAKEYVFRKKEAN